MSSSSGVQREVSGGAVGLTMFASVMLIMVGLFQFFAGLASVINDELFVIGVEYVYKLDVSAWGWIHLIMGTVVFFAGIFLLRGAVWARTVAVIVAVVSAFANFLWLPLQPWWSIIMITMNVFVIWAVTVHGRDITRVD